MKPKVGSLRRLIKLIIIKERLTKKKKNVFILKLRIRHAFTTSLQYYAERSNQCLGGGILKETCRLEKK